MNGGGSPQNQMYSIYSVRRIFWNTILNYTDRLISCIAKKKITLCFLKCKNSDKITSDKTFEISRSHSRASYASVSQA